ncbi:MAG: hypothetical protein M3R55_18105, partial [Acidobacteriota bacterium]|nr:hypothetical protein [Acidobacteriota bacterium]
MFIAVMAGACLVAPAPSVQLVDRLAAVVAGEPIFLSDVRQVMRLRLLEPSGVIASLRPADAGRDEAGVLEWMIDRTLVLGEIARYAPAPPAKAEIDAALQLWRARVAADPQHERVDPAVIEFITGSLRIERYIDQRFTAAAQPARDEAPSDEARRRIAE